MGLCTDGVQRQGKDGAAGTDVKSGGFCKEIGSSFSTINEWENGVRHSNYIMQRKFAAFCEENKISFEE